MLVSLLDLIVTFSPAIVEPSDLEDAVLVTVLVIPSPVTVVLELIKFWSFIFTVSPLILTSPLSVLSIVPLVIFVSPCAEMLISFPAVTPAWLDTVWFPFSSYPRVDSIVISPPASRSTLPPAVTVPPTISMLFPALIDASPPAEIPPWNPPVALFITSPVTSIFTFPPAEMFPFTFVKLSPEMLISPPVLILEPAPPPVSPWAILILVSFPKYTCGTKTTSPSTSISTYHTISFSRAFIWSGVSGLPISRPNPPAESAALSNIVLI